MKKERKTTNINVRVTPKLRRAVEKEAKKLGATKSKFILHLIRLWFDNARFGKWLRESAKGRWQKQSNIAEILKKAAEESLR